MALINGIISSQGFEIVRDIIGGILKTELENQKTLQGFTYPVNVYTNRFAPFQQSEELMINVLMDNINYGDINEVDSQGRTIFNIDVFCNGKATDTNIGGYNATVVRDKFLGMCRHILSSSKYKTLGLQLGLIGGTYVESIDAYEPPNAQDSSFITMGRISFAVRILEGSELWEGITLDNSVTTVKLDETNLGYEYKIK